MKVKKIISCLLIAMMLVTMAACGKNENDGATANAGQDDNSGSSGTASNAATSDADGFYTSVAAGGETTDQVSILVGWTSESPNDTLVQQLMKEKVGIDYVCEYMQSSDYLTTLNLKLSSGADLPDIMIFPYDINVQSALITADRIMNLNDVYTSDKLTNIPNIDSRIQSYIKTSSGDMWWIPGWYANEYDNPWGGWTVDAWWIRTDLLEAAGKTDADVTTIEGLEDTMRAMATLTDSNGSAIIPLSFVQGDNHEERLIISTFGVDTANGVSGMPAVMNIDGNFVFEYDNPNYKEAYRWMNQMYREGLIDMEVATMSQERFKEKIVSGQIGMFTTDLWESGLNETWKNYNTGDESVTMYYEPYNDPAVEGVTSGSTSYVNPNPQYMVYINKDTKHVNAALNFLEWVNDPSPYRQQEISEGPVDTNWYFTDEASGTWDFEESYKEERDSGDSARVAAVTPQLWQFASYSNAWYPWWNQNQTGATVGAGLTSKYCKVCNSEVINFRSITDYDNVKVDVDSVISENLASLKSVVDEYTAKMVMADSDEKFEEYYTEFQKRLDLVANWSEMKDEWMTLYTEQFGE